MPHWTSIRIWICVFSSSFHFSILAKVDYAVQARSEQQSGNSHETIIFHSQIIFFWLVEIEIIFFLRGGQNFATIIFISSCLFRPRLLLRAIWGFLNEHEQHFFVSAIGASNNRAHFNAKNVCLFLCCSLENFEIAQSISGYFFYPAKAIFPWFLRNCNAASSSHFWPERRQVEKLFSAWLKFFLLAP